MITRREQKRARNRLKLIEATMDSIAEHGLAETTVSTVVVKAGLSQGIVNLHFDSKQALLEETLRFLTEEWRDAWAKALEQAGTEPAVQLRAILLVVFDPPVFSRKRLAVWHSFWANSKYRSTYRTICGASDRAYRVSLHRLCTRLLEESGRDDDVSLVADSLATFISGAWLDLLTIPRIVNRERAKRMCVAQLERAFPEHYEGWDNNRLAAARG